jgi:cell division protein ZapA
MKRVVDVEIMGEKFTVKGDAEEDYIRMVADYVDDKVDELLKTTHVTGRLGVAVMTALNIADEYLQLKEQHQMVLNRLDHLVKRLAITLADDG